MRYLTVILFFIFFSGDASSKTWTVSKNGEINSLQNAISMASAGDTILVLQGVYQENGTIRVSKKLFLKGIGYPVIDGRKKSEIIEITANGTILEGMDIRNSGLSSYEDIAAVRIKGARNVIVRDNKLDENFFGIYGEHAVNCIISGNTLTSNARDEINSANGIHCWKSDSMFILNNKISGHRDGIYFEFVTNSVIRGNHSEKNIRYGLHFMFSHEDTYHKNTFKNNGAGVAVMYSRGVRMFGNTFINNWGGSSYGLLLKDISDSHIEGNQFLTNTTGLYMEGSSRIIVKKNRFLHNGWALKVQASCIDNSINENNFIANTFDMATNGTLVENNFDGNYWDKYEGYDLDRNGIGDISFRPVTMYSMIVERNPTTMMLFRSFMISLMDRAEKVIPGMTPLNLYDSKPSMKPIKL